MRGVVLSGWSPETRPTTGQIVNHYLTTIYDRPLIDYAILNLRKSGIKDILIIIGDSGAGDLVDHVRSGKRYGVRIQYAYQDSRTGIAGALSLARGFTGSSKFCTLLGESVFQHDLSRAARAFLSCGKDALTVVRSTRHHEPTEHRVAYYKKSYSYSPTFEPDSFSLTPSTAELREQTRGQGQVRILTGACFYTPAIYDLLSQYDLGVNPSACEIMPIHEELRENNQMRCFKASGWWHHVRDARDVFRLTNSIHKQGYTYDDPRGHSDARL